MCACECMGESTQKSHMIGDKHKMNTCTTLSLTQSALVGTFLSKEVTSSCDLRSESGFSRTEGNNAQKGSQRRKKKAAIKNIIIILVTFL